jgi:hypothetical protein
VRLRYNERVNGNVRHLPDPPPDSNLVISYQGNDTIVHKPAPGLARLASHLIVSAAVAGAGIVLWLVVPEPDERSLLFVSFHILAGVYLAASTVHLSSVRISITTGPEGLVLTRKGMLGERRQRWSREDVIDVHRRGIRSVGLTTRAGSQYQLIGSGSRDEALWLLRTVRQSLGFPVSGGRRILPEGSAMQWRADAHGATIVVPPTSETTGLFVLVTAVFLALVGIVAWQALNPRPGDDLAAIVFFLVFLSVSLGGSAIHFLNQTRLPVTLELLPDRLVIHSPYVFGLRRREWSRSAIRDVVALGSRVAVIVTTTFGRKPIRLHAESDAEARWIADVLCHEMKLDEEEAPIEP